MTQPDDDGPLFPDAYSPFSAGAQPPLVPVAVVAPPSQDPDEDLTQTPMLPDALALADFAAARERMGDALPEHGWLAEYVLAHLPLTDAPVEFHVAAGLSLISTALGNRVARQVRGKPMFPHTWAVVVAPSGRWRKSHANGLADTIAARSMPGCFLPNAFSTEGLIAALAKKPAGRIWFDEFGSFLAMIMRDFNGGAKSLFMDLFTSGAGNVRKNTMGGGEVIVPWPAITIIAATTIENLTGLLPRKDFATGLMPRFVLITSTTHASARPDTEEGVCADPILINRLIRGLGHLRQIGPQSLPVVGQDWQPARVLATPGALAMYNEWIENGGGWQKMTAQTEVMSFNPDSFVVRLEDYIWKYAIQYRAAACALDKAADPLLVGEAEMKSAIAMVCLNWHSMMKVIGEDYTENEDEMAMKRLNDLVRDERPRNEVLRAFRGKARAFDEYLDTLCQRGEIVVVPKEGASGRSTLYLQPGPASKHYAKWRAAEDAREDARRAALAQSLRAGDARFAREEPGFASDEDRAALAAENVTAQETPR
jgi:hypothetical protein